MDKTKDSYLQAYIDGNYSGATQNLTSLLEENPNQYYLLWYGTAFL